MTSLSLRNFTDNNTNPGPHLSNVVSSVKSSVNTAKKDPSRSLQGLYHLVLHHSIITFFGLFFSRMSQGEATPPAADQETGRVLQDLSPA